MLIVLHAFVLGAVCALCAERKNRNWLLWFFLGMFFAYIALIAISILDDPTKHKTGRTKNYNRYEYEKHI